MKSPNILFLFADQMRADAIGALGGHEARTPALDRLVREGVHFSRAYTPTPVCMAARAALVTGIPGHVSGCTDNMAMDQSRRTFMAALSEQHYQVHGVGKMHFGPDSRALWGFESRDYCEEMSPDDDFRTMLQDSGYGHVLEPHGLRGDYYYTPQPSQLPAELHESTWVADRSREFLARRDRRRPFMLFSSFIKPHPPFESPAPWNRLHRSPEMPDPYRPEGFEDQQCFWNHVQNRYKYRDGGYDRQNARNIIAAYRCAVSFVDYNIGRILEALGDEAANTLIVFSADHGEMLGDFGSYGKRCMLDPAVRIPLLMRHPEHLAAGTTCDTPVTLLDLFSTFTATAGAREDATPDSLDLVAVAKGEENREIAFAQFSERSLGLYMAASRNGKYVHSVADEQDWYFDHTTDPRESSNRIDDPAFQSAIKHLRSAAWNTGKTLPARSMQTDGKPTAPLQFRPTQTSDSSIRILRGGRIPQRTR